jgi:hypothetical protein
VSATRLATIILIYWVTLCKPKTICMCWWFCCRVSPVELNRFWQDAPSVALWGLCLVKRVCQWTQGFQLWKQQPYKHFRVWLKFFLFNFGLVLPLEVQLDCKADTVKTWARLLSCVKSPSHDTLDPFLVKFWFKLFASWFIVHQSFHFPELL